MKLVAPGTPWLDWAEGYEPLIGLGLREFPLRELLMDEALRSETAAGPGAGEIWQRNENAELELKARALERLAAALRQHKRPVPPGPAKTLLEALIEAQDNNQENRRG